MLGPRLSLVSEGPPKLHKLQRRPRQTQAKPGRVFGVDFGDRPVLRSGGADGKRE